LNNVSGVNPPVVLIVEDDGDVSAVMAHTLNQRGFQTLSASDSGAAMAIYQEREGKIDVLITDLSLPGEVPGDLARWVASTYPSTRIVYASGIPRHVALTAGLVEPGAPYLEKPVHPNVLASTLQSLLSRPTTQR
jgi:DNA-binding response OmpR family regulator